MGHPREGRGVRAGPDAECVPEGRGHRLPACDAVPLLAGRQFTRDDRRATGLVVILNQTAARTLFPNADPIGQVVLLGGTDEWRIVGVVADVRHQALEQDSGLEVYIPYAQLPDFGTLAMVVQSRLPAASLARGVKAALVAADPMLPVGDYQTLQAVVDRSVSPRRFILLILGSFAG